MLISIAFSLCSTLTTLVLLSAPFCVLQLALCRFFPVHLIRFAPPVLFGTGFLWSLWYLDQHYNWDALLGILVMFPCILGLIGSGLGWFLWKRRQNIRK